MISLFILALIPLSKAQITVNPESITVECLKKLNELNTECIAEVKFWGEQVSLASNDTNQQSVAFCNNFDAISAW
jgi:hypothetical protein